MFRTDVAGDVVVGIHIVRTLGVNVGLHGRNHRFGGRRVVDAGPIDEAESGEHLGPLPFRKHGPSRTTIDEPVRRHRDDEDVAFAPRRLQMADVAHMQKIEDPVRQDDLTAGVSFPFGDRPQLGDRTHFVPG